MASNPPNGEKKTERFTVWLSEQLLLDLSRLADADDRKLSEYVEKVLDRHVNGHGRRVRSEEEAASRGD
jgi:hypothetical protein